MKTRRPLTLATLRGRFHEAVSVRHKRPESDVPHHRPERLTRRLLERVREGAKS